MRMRWLVMLLCAWGIPGFLFLLVTVPEYQYQARRMTLHNLHKAYRVIQIYQEAFAQEHQGNVTPTLRQVSEYARFLGKKLEIYDRYGLKFEMRYLDASRVVLRSSGWLSEYRGVNHEHPYFQGLFVASKDWDQLFPMVIHNYPKPPALYQPAQLESSASSNKKYAARLFVYDAVDHNNKPMQYRTLVVVKIRKRRKDPVLITSMRVQPEEFIWFPSRDHQLLVFTSSPNQEHVSRGPLHVFDAENIELKTIFIGKDEDNALDHRKQAQKSSYLAALAGAEEDKLYVYLLPYRAQKSLSPSALFNPHNLYQVHITFPHNQLRARAGKVDLSQNFLLRREYSSPREGTGNDLQKQWFDLKVVGNLEQNIDRWQKFALLALEQHSPVFPYACVTLISLYEKASRLYAREENEVGLSRAPNHALDFAKKYAQLVYEKPVHPLWLRMVGWESLVRLQDGRRLNIKAITPRSRERWD